MSPETTNYILHFQHRVLQDALNQAVADYWLRRAEVFEATKPAIADFHGHATLPHQREQWKRAHETAQACRNRAALATMFDEYPDDVITAMREAV